MDLLEEVLAKIKDGTVQKEDFNRLILARRPVLEDVCPSCPHCGSTDTHHARAVDKTKTHGEPGYFANAMCYECNNGFSDDNYGALNESTPEAIRDRVRRRTSENVTDSHLSHDGHQPLSGPQFVDRVAPKRKPVGQQSHGISKLAHRQSTRTQRRHAMEAVEFIVKSHNKPISESELSRYSNSILSAVINKLMTDPRFNRDWLYSLSKQIECQIQKTT